MHEQRLGSCHLDALQDTTVRERVNSLHAWKLFLADGSQKITPSSSARLPVSRACTSIPCTVRHRNKPLGGPSPVLTDNALEFACVGVKHPLAVAGHRRLRITAFPSSTNRLVLEQIDQESRCTYSSPVRLVWPKAHERWSKVPCDSDRRTPLINSI